MEKDNIKKKKKKERKKKEKKKKKRKKYLLFTSYLRSKIKKKIVWGKFKCFSFFFFF